MKTKLTQTSNLNKNEAIDKFQLYDLLKLSSELNELFNLKK